MGSGALGAAAVTTLSNAFIADCTILADRAGAFGIAFAAIGPTIIIGPLAGGMIVKYYGNYILFVTAASIQTVAVLYVCMVVVCLLYILFQLEE